MNELDKLKPEVREAYSTLDAEVSPSGRVSYEAYRAWCTIHAELVRMARDNEALRGKCNVIMSGSTQHLGRAERAESELAALKRRIAESPVVECPPDKPTTEDGWLQVIEWAKGVNWTKGRRVRLLLDDEKTPVTPAA